MHLRETADKERQLLLFPSQSGRTSLLFIWVFSYHHVFMLSFWHISTFFGCCRWNLFIQSLLFILKVGLYEYNHYISFVGHLLVMCL